MTKLASQAAAPHSVDLETGAIVGVTVQGADGGDTTTIQETLPEAAEQLEAVAAVTNEAVAVCRNGRFARFPTLQKTESPSGLAPDWLRFDFGAQFLSNPLPLLLVKRVLAPETIHYERSRVQLGWSATPRTLGSDDPAGTEVVAQALRLAIFEIRVLRFQSSRATPFAHVPWPSALVARRA